MTTWTIEFYEDANGKRPVEAWMDGLGDVQIGALAAAIEEVLAKRGLDLASTPWLKAPTAGVARRRGAEGEAEALSRLCVWVSAHTLVSERSDHGQDLR